MKFVVQAVNEKSAAKAGCRLVTRIRAERDETYELDYINSWGQRGRGALQVSCLTKTYNKYRIHRFHVELIPIYFYLHIENIV